MAADGEAFDPDDQEHREWRAQIARLLGLEVDLRDIVDLTETVDVRDAEGVRKTA